MAKNLLNSVKLVKPNSSVFDLTCDRKLSCNMGQLIPVYVEDCLPGDHWRISQESMARLAAMVFPMMHRVDMYFHCFFVPDRLLWDHFEDWITGTGTPPAVPYYNMKTKWSIGGLLDHLGLPDPVGNDFNVTAKQASAYQFIWNEYYRDENLQTAMLYKLDDGDNTSNVDLFKLQRRCWEHDPFTSALPFAQKGDPVLLPIGSFQDVPVFRDAPGGPDSLSGTPDAVNLTYLETSSAIVEPLDMYAQTSQLLETATTIRDFRRAMKLQEFLERAAVSGTRYNEFLYGMFGVVSPDKRLQRPEYITGSKSPISVSEVLQTSQTDTTPQGTMAGHGVGYSNGYGGSYYCQEHGQIMCLMSIMPKPAYYQGIPKKFLKIDDRFETFFTQFEHIGEQEITFRELHTDSATPLATFGYTPRYVEYKTAFNTVSGQFRDTLIDWTMVRDLPNTVALNSDFVKCEPTMRVFADTNPSDDHLFVYILNKIQCRRLMSKYSTPRM